MAEPQRSRIRAANRARACLLVIALGALFAAPTEAGLLLEGDLRRDVVSEPPVFERHAEHLDPFGERFSFFLTVPGQRAELSVDLVPGTRVLFRFVRNTIAAGCSRPLIASLVGPHGRLWSKTRLCTGRETIAFRATKNGLHYLTFDPPAGRTGTIAVMLYLDQPEVEPGGPFFDDLTFINGSRSYRLSASAVYRKGIARVWVREAGAATLASSSRCRSRCPVRLTLRATIDTRRMVEGEHEYHVEAIGSDGRSSGIETRRVFVDRTPPRPPKGFRVESYDSVQRTAVVTWDEGSDPDLRDGTPGAGTYGHEYRLRAEDGSWSQWRQADAMTLAIGGISPGRLIGLRVREYDGAMNVSRISEARLRVTGSEPRPEDPEA